MFLKKCKYVEPVWKHFMLKSLFILFLKILFIALRMEITNLPLINLAVEIKMIK